ncbi:MAG TPA: YtxH domain-containing protein [Candidatus Binatia bacterium]|nr:YtxH domain-containing protein [Candidatus Binatia bacterium]
MKTTEEEGLVILMIGLTVGLLAGLLWAPRAGSETRRALRRGAQDNLNYLIEEAERVRNSTDRLVDTSKEWLDRLKTPCRAVKASAGSGSEDLTRQA